MMSFAVVMNGPVAKAGSILRFSSIRGTNAPNKAANTITNINDIPTVVLRALSKPKIKVTKKIILAQMAPFRSPTLSSFARRLAMSEVLMFEVARPCTTIADDCTPTFPPIAAMSGIKSAISGFETMSNAPITYAPPTPPPRPISSHGNLALVKVPTES